MLIDRMAEGGKDTMTLSRSVVVPGMNSEYNAFADLLDTLSVEDWETPSRCAGWRVADVAAHVVGQLTDVTALRLEGLGTPEVTARQVDERRSSSAGELAEELRTTTKAATDLVEGFDEVAFESEGPQGNGQTLGFGLESLWFDTYLHADDIRDALGVRRAAREGLAPSVSHISQVLSQQEWPPATIRLSGLDEFLVSGGDSGRLITGDPMQFILVSTGRADPTAMGLDPAVNIYR
jgi:uncharacterized protein (TIGR03083 family)